MKSFKGTFALLIISVIALGSFASTQYPATEKAKFRTEVGVQQHHVVVVCSYHATALVNAHANVVYAMLISPVSKEQSITKDCNEAPLNFRWLNLQRYYSCNELSFTLIKNTSGLKSGKNGCNEFALLPPPYLSFDQESYWIPLKIGEPTGQLHESALMPNNYLLLHNHCVSLIC